MVTSGTVAQRLVLRVDAGVRIGLGHLSRCFALSEAWQAAGGTAAFISACEGDDLPARIEGAGFEFVPVPFPWPDERDLKLTLGVLSQQHQRSWLVLDGYHFDADYQRQVKAAGHRLLVIDDIREAQRYYADAVLNQNLGAEQITYPCEPGTCLMLGVGYVLLRREFARWRERRVETPSAARRLLVTLGGADPDNQALKVIQALQLLKRADLDATVVVGPQHPDPDRLEEAGRKSRVPVRLFRNPPNMPELMASADLAVSGGGSTCWELAFMGVPNLIMVLADNQRAIAEALDQAGVSRNLGWFWQVGEPELAGALEELMGDQPRRRLMSRRGQQLVDGKGSERVVQRLREWNTR